MNKFIKEKEKQEFSKFRVLVRVMYFCVFILSAFQIIISNSLTTSGDKIAKFQKDSEKLRYENKLLEEEIAKTNSLYALTQLASQNGFIKSSSVQIFSPVIPVAQGRLN